MKKLSKDIIKGLTSSRVKPFFIKLYIMIKDIIFLFLLGLIFFLSFKVMLHYKLQPLNETIAKEMFSEQLIEKYKDAVKGNIKYIDKALKCTCNK